MKSIILLISILLLNNLYSQEKFDVEVAEADYLFSNKEYKNAIIEYDKVIKGNDKESYNYYLRGLSKYNLEDNMGAIKDFTKAYLLIKNDALNGNWIYGPRTFKFNDTYMNAELGLSPVHKFFHLFLYRGHSKYKLEDYRGAILDLKEYIKYDNTDDDFPGIHKLIGDCYFMLQQYPEAIKFYTEAINLNPADKSAYFSRGVSFLNNDALESACIDLSKSGELGNEKAYELITEYCR